MSFSRFAKNYANQIAFVGYVSWGSLGMYRGYQRYKYEIDKSYNDYLIRIEENKERLSKGQYEYSVRKPKQFYYTHAFLFSSFIGLVYCVPPFIPFMLIREVERLEINVRGIHQTDKEKYYDIIW